MPPFAVVFVVRLYVIVSLFILGPNNVILFAVEFSDTDEVVGLAVKSYIVTVAADVEVNPLLSVQL